MRTMISRLNLTIRLLGYHQYTDFRRVVISTSAFGLQFQRSVPAHRCSSNAMMRCESEQAILVSQETPNDIDKLVQRPRHYVLFDTLNISELHYFWRHSSENFTIMFYVILFVCPCKITCPYKSVRNSSNRSTFVYKLLHFWLHQNSIKWRIIAGLFY